MFENIFTKDKKRKLKDINLHEISLVDSPANQIPFLIVKSEHGEVMNSLEEILVCEEFNETEIEKVDAVLKQLSYLDGESADAISNLCLAVATNPELAKSCAQGYWPSLTGTKVLVELPCLVEKSELNEVESFFQKFVSSDESEFELSIIDNALEVIADLDSDSLNAVHSLMKLDWNEANVEKWPSITNRQSAVETEPVKKKSSGLRWPTMCGQM